jgi:hypothetical protein
MVETDAETIVSVLLKSEVVSDGDNTRQLPSSPLPKSEVASDGDTRQLPPLPKSVKRGYSNTGIQADDDLIALVTSNHQKYLREFKASQNRVCDDLIALIMIIIIRGATALTNLGRLSSRRWQSFPTAADGTGLTCGQYIESHSCIFSFLNRTVTSLFK